MYGSWQFKEGLLSLSIGGWTDLDELWRDLKAFLQCGRYVSAGNEFKRKWKELV